MVGIGEGGVWVVVGVRALTTQVARVDPSSLLVTARIPVLPGAIAVRVGYGAVWVTNPARSLVQKIDPKLKRVVRTTKVGPRPRFFAVGEDGVWTLNQGRLGDGARSADGGRESHDPRRGVR